MNVTVERVRLPASVSSEQAVVGELHLVRRRVDRVLEELVHLAVSSEDRTAWLQVEEATRIARRGIAVALASLPTPAAARDESSELLVGRWRVDRREQRQWYGEAEVALSPLQHRLLATFAAEPQRVFGRAELARSVWRDASSAENAVKVAVGRIRVRLSRRVRRQARFSFRSTGSGGRSANPTR